MRRTLKGERGQVLPLVMLALVGMLGMSAFVVDVGYAYYGKRKLQSAVDAAALAGAQKLPVAADAQTAATYYATVDTPSEFSGIVSGSPRMQVTASVGCTTTVIFGQPCTPGVTAFQNAVTVTGTLRTDTYFASIFGIDHFNVSAKAKACKPCGSKPIDVAVVIDRTGSMCDNSGSSTSCTDLNNAKDGVRSMLGVFTTPQAKVGMLTLPPLRLDTTTNAVPNVCSVPVATSGTADYFDGPTTSNLYPSTVNTKRLYLVDPLSYDYRVGSGPLNAASGLMLHTAAGGSNSGCIKPGGNTSYTQALREAQTELQTDGSPSAPDYIVFMTDGEANIGGSWQENPTGYDNDDAQPCASAIRAANAIRAAGTSIYTIGYSLSTAKCTYGGWRNKSTGAICTPLRSNTNCVHKASLGNESPTIDATTTLKAIADAGQFYNKATPGDLTMIFQAIANDIQSGQTRLVEDAY